MQVLFMDAHVFVTRYCSYLCIPECFHLHLLYCIHCIASFQGEFQVQGELLGLFRLNVCMCQQEGEFWEKWSNKGETCLIFLKNLLCTGFESASFWESCTCERVKFCLGSFCSVLGSWFSSFSLCFLHDCVERYLCLWGVMFRRLIDCVEPLPLS